MKLFYASQKLQRTLDRKADCVRTYGAERAKIIIRRLGQIRAAPTMAELLLYPGRFHLLTANLAGHFSASISANYRLILRPHPAPAPTTSDGGLDTARVTECLVTEIGDYHGT
jgi:proteic killer suppression protein